MQVIDSIEEEDFNESNDQKLLQIFVGEKYEKIKNGKFNVWAFLFTTCYMFYRKMFLYGLIYFFIVSILNTALSILTGVSFVGFAVSAAIAIALGFLSNKIYLIWAQKKVDKIKTKNYSNVENICIKKGGTSIGLIFGGIFTEIAITIIIMLILIVTIGSVILSGFTSLLSFYSSDVDDTSESLVNTSDEETNTVDYYYTYPSESSDNEIESTEAESTVYNGVLAYNSSIILADEFEIEIPDIFEESITCTEYSYQYEYDTGSEGTFTDCEFSFGAISGFLDAEDLITQMQEYNENASKISTGTINDILWYGFSSEDSLGKTYYYGTNKDDNVYLFKFTIGSDADESCVVYRSKLLNSITAK